MSDQIPVIFQDDRIPVNLVLTEAELARFEIMQAIVTGREESRHRRRLESIALGAVILLCFICVIVAIVCAFFNNPVGITAFLGAPIVVGLIRSFAPAHDRRPNSDNGRPKKASTNR